MCANGGASRQGATTGCACRDPITAYDNAKGYLFNIAMLKRVFSPKFYLHDIRQTGEHEATTRWTMVGTIALSAPFWYSAIILSESHAFPYPLLLSFAGSQLHALKHACLTSHLACSEAIVHWHPLTSSTGRCKLIMAHAWMCNVCCVHRDSETCTEVR